MGSGYYRMHRGWMDHPVFADEPYTEREAWLWLIEHAVWKDTRTRVGSAVMDLKRGQLGATTRYLAAKWRWTEARVRRFLKRLREDGMVDAQATRKATLITIEKYDDYQTDRRTDDTGSDAEPTQKRRRSDANSTHKPTHETPAYIGKNNNTRRTGDAGTTLERRKIDASKKEGKEIEEINTPVGAAAPPDPERRLFSEGKRVLGKNAGGLIAKLLRASNEDATEALGVILMAEEKQDPREYVGAVIRDGPSAITKAEERANQARIDEIRQQMAERRKAMN